MRLLLCLLAATRSAAIALATPSRAQRAMQMKSGALTVSVEVATGVSESSLELLSMQLRKANVAALWTSDVDAVGTLVEEQATAKGDFPGPCPVVFSGDAAQAEAAIAAGAAAVVLGADQLGCAAADATEVVWAAESEDDIRSLVAAGRDAGAFLVGGSADALAALPDGALAIGAVDAMQPEGAEVDAGRALAAAGCGSVLVRGAVRAPHRPLNLTPRSSRLSCG